MFYLFILESIGTSELLLIGLVALLIFGPRKLPELARMLGKARNEFKRTTDDFRQTWEREVDFENIEKETESELNGLGSQNSIQRTNAVIKDEIAMPEVKEISQASFEENNAEEAITVPKQPDNNLTDKRDWL